MSGRLVDGSASRGDLSLAVDVVVCGGGAGGAMACRELAAAGLSVVLLEEGSDHLPAHSTQREDEMIPELFHEMGGRKTDDLSILILSGKGLGGSTIHNTNLCKRIPPALLTHWRDDLRIDGVDVPAMSPVFDEVERDLGVVPIHPLRVNPHNAILKRGVEALGYRGGVLSHNRDERCVGSGFCELGCSYDGKLNARRVLVPAALAKGAAIHTHARVERVRVDRDRVRGVEGWFVHRDGRRRYRFTVRARAVCLSGSAIGSAAIALRSGLHDPHAQLGRGLRIHPAGVVAGLFDETIEAWRGIPQSFECTEFLDVRPGSDRRVWIVPSFAHPAGMASFMPGFGPSLMRQMRAYPRLAALAAMIHDETSGEVRVDGDRVRIRYRPTLADREQLALGAREAAKLLLAAGAREVIVPAIAPIRIRSEADTRAVTAARFGPHDARLSAVHPMGTLRMSRDPKDGVVDARGQHHFIRGLYVVDGSLFPTSIGGPPQIPIYAFGMKVARHVVEDLQAPSI